MSQEYVDRIAEKWNAVFNKPEQSPEPEQPEPGKGNIVPNAGNSPGQLSAEQLAALEAQSHGGDTFAQKTNWLQKLIQQQNQ